MNGHTEDYSDHAAFGSKHMARGVGRLTENSFLSGEGEVLVSPHFNLQDEGLRLNQMETDCNTHPLNAFPASFASLIASNAGSYITNTENETFLDLTCGIGVTNLGHCHPRVTAAAAKQCGQLVHAQVSLQILQREGSIPFHFLSC